MPTRSGSLSIALSLLALAACAETPASRLDGSSAHDQSIDADDAAGDRGTPTIDTGAPQPDGAVDDAPRADLPHGTPPAGCADPSDPSLTAAERQLLGLPADSWFAAPNSRLIDTCKQTSSYGDGIYLVSGCAAIVSAWGGGALDTQRQQLIVWGGGHNDYGGNEVYAFDLRSLTWKQLTQPSAPPFNKDPLDDGQPVSRHTYDGVEFIAHRGTIFAWGGSRSSDGNGTALTWELAPDSGAWTNLGPTPPQASSPYDFGLAYDPISKRVLLHSHAYLGAYDFAANSWSRLQDFGYPPYTGTYDLWKSRVGAVDPVRRLFVTLGGGTPVLVYDIDADQVLSGAAPWDSLSSSAQFLQHAAPGLDYDEATAQLVAWSGGAPQALDATATPHRWVPRSSSGAPALPTGNGVYGRWRYAPRYNVFVLVNDASDDVRFYKHTAGCGG